MTENMEEVQETEEKEEVAASSESVDDAIIEGAKQRMVDNLKKTVDEIAEDIVAADGKESEEKELHEKWERSQSAELSSEKKEESDEKKASSEEKSKDEKEAEKKEPIVLDEVDRLRAVNANVMVANASLQVSNFQIQMTNIQIQMQNALDAKKEREDKANEITEEIQEKYDMDFKKQIVDWETGKVSDRPKGPPMPGR